MHVMGGGGGGSSPIKLFPPKIIDAPIGSVLTPPKSFFMDETLTVLLLMKLHFLMQ